jgi:hypothetical protein
MRFRLQREADVDQCRVTKCSSQRDYWLIPAAAGSRVPVLRLRSKDNETFSGFSSPQWPLVAAGRGVGEGPTFEVSCPTTADSKISADCAAKCVGVRYCKLLSGRGSL